MELSVCVTRFNSSTRGYRLLGRDIKYQDKKFQVNPFVLWYSKHFIIYRILKYSPLIWRTLTLFTTPPFRFCPWLLSGIVVLRMFSDIDDLIFTFFLYQFQQPRDNDEGDTQTTFCEPPPDLSSNQSFRSLTLNLVLLFFDILFLLNLNGLMRRDHGVSEFVLNRL